MPLIVFPCDSRDSRYDESTAMNSIRLSSILLCALTSAAIAQQHEFTNKETGVQILAEIVAVDANWQSMTIRKDGNTFNIAPNILILDDQQFVKDWLKEQGITEPNQAADPEMSASGATPNVDLSRVSLEVTLTKKQVSSDKEKYSSYMDLVTKNFRYDIKVRNIGREVLPASKMSYALVWREGVQFSSGTYYTSSTKSDYATQGEADLEPIGFNFEQSVETSNVEINSVTYENNDEYRTDELLGAVVRLTLSDGTEIGEYLSNDAEREKLTWAKVTALPSNPTARSSRSRDDDEDMDDEITLQLRKGQAEDGPVRLQGRDILIQARASADTQAQDGVIVAIGGAKTGISLFVKDQKIYGCITMEGESKTVSASLPLGEFETTLELTERGFSLAVNGGTPVTRTDVSRFGQSTPEGINVGSDADTPVGPYPRNFAFAGEIDDVRVAITR